MLHRIALLSCVVGLLGCGSVKQQQPPRIPDADDAPMSEDAGGGDMDSGEEGTIAPAEATKEKTPEEQKLECCKECVEGVAKDTSGDPPGALNCSSLVGAACVLFIEKNPMTGGEAQKCVEEAGGGDAEAPPADG